MLRNSAALADDGPPGAGGEQLPLAGERLPPAEDPVPPEHGPPPEGEMMPDVPLDRARVEELHQERQLQHLGRQPRTPYKLGATDVMMEWEDMFPFSGALRPAAAGNHYSRAEVRQIIAEAKRLGLGVIPLVQTFGHLELFPQTGAVFPPARVATAPGGALSVPERIRVDWWKPSSTKVMELHAGAAELHVGCDEVYHMGVCDLCQHRLRDELFLGARGLRGAVRAPSVRGHAADLGRHDASHSGRYAAPLRRIGELVEPMVWVYAEDVDRFAGPHVYSTFSEVFPRAWTAAAYKGAFGETLILPPLQRHLDNTLNWLATMRRESDRFSGRVRRHGHLRVAASKGWLTEYNVERNYSNPFRVDELTEMYYSHKHMLSAMVGSVKSALTGVVDRYTIAEWVEQKLWPYLRRLERLQEQADALKRPLGVATPAAAHAAGTRPVRAERY
ncbi:Hexosaminidase D [Amphibalanus amphitrite]|uniref:Hexosaminidase D n=1 Tax=Amphibalanus amphitrite TaxID=1232801 RepID=A0A6A4WJ09_AMPAM|nr:Hexosaminidase D [Amphibalanus amphitrite]